MHGRGKSDDPVVPAKLPNNAQGGAAEVVEGSGSAEGNAVSETRSGRSAGPSALSDLDRVRRVARKDKDARFTALLHHVDVDRLRAAYWAIRPKAAPGVDGVTWTEYGQDLEANLRDLHARVHRGSYRARPSRRVFIPKADGRLRPLGVAALEDKILQRALVEVLNAIYEADFLGFSYGFRPGRSPHDALDALAAGITRKKVNWVLDTDFREFFTSLDHRWLERFLEHRIADRRVLRLIQKWMAAGVIEDGALTETLEGVPQGASASPLLANVYLHVCPERKVKRCRRSFCDSCCAGDGGGSSGLAVQAGSPNRRGVMPVKSRGGKRLRNGSLSAGQVRDEKTNMVEPLLTHRKTMTASQPGLVHISGRAPCYLAWCSQGTACVSLWRCSVLRWRELVAGAGMEQENLCLETVDQAGCVLVARGRTLGGRNRLGQSTARRRGGPARTSVEGPVMGLERRGRAGQLTRMPTRWSGRS
jgi:retron-type reverse transcriptase